MKRRRIVQSLTTAAGVLAATVAFVASAQASPGNDFIQGNLQPLQNLTTNPCGTTARDFGTNFSTPSDPNGFGFANQTAIGWEGNIYAPFEYLSGSYFARGVNATFRNRCGGMYTFGAYTWGLPSGTAPAPGSVQWNMADGYLPAMITSFTRNDVHISITDFADKQTIAGSPAELVYTRISVTNNSDAAVDVPPGASGPNLVELDSNSDTVQPGTTVNRDFVAAVDTFTVGGTLPTVAQITADASTYDAAFAHMKSFWNSRLASIPTLSLPNVSLPNTNNLQDPGTAIDNAYKAAFVYTHIVQSGASPFSGANNYDWLLNHDLPGIMDNRFMLGDFNDAQNMLLIGRISEQPNFNEFGANWYWDGVWRTPLAWAQYLESTNNVAFVKAHFDDDANGPTAWGPSLFTMMHTDLLQQLDPSTGYLKFSFDNDSGGTWVFDDLTALAGLQAYSYIAQRIGNTEEAQWAQNEYKSLLNATNAGLQQNETTNGANALPCEVNVPITQDRCGSAMDANWASQLLWGENQWTDMLQGGQLNGILGSASQADNMYQLGFSRLVGTGVPFPSFGAYTGYSVALNTGYSADALFGNQYRDLPITSYAWQIATTTGGPNSWWEANGSAPDPTNPWAGSHAAPQFGADPYVWPMAGQTQTVLQSLVAQGLTNSVGADGTPWFKPVIYIGRGVPDAWITPGKTISVDNLTSSFNETTGQRKTYGVDISTSREGGSTAVHVSLSGDVPARNLQVQLPAFADEGVQSVDGGKYDATTETVKMNGNSAIIRLGNAAKPTVNVSVASTVPGTHTQPVLVSGESTTATATFTNNGGSKLQDVNLTPSVPSGWTVEQTSATHWTFVLPGQTVTATFAVTPPDNASGGNGVIVSASFDNGFGASETASAEQWLSVQRPLPLPPGTVDLALTATPSASYASPWTTITAINNGIFPIQSSDDSDLTPYWGTWPMAGTQYMELDWNSPITTNGTSVYFADDGGGLQLPASWVVQWWDGSQWQNVTNVTPNYPEADNVFNAVTFDPVTTTKLRVSMVTSSAPEASGVGAIQWIVPSIPSGG